MEEELHDNVDVGKASRNQNGTSKNGAIQNEKVKKKSDMNEVQRYCCQKFAHYARDCYFNKDNGDDNGVTQLAHVGSSDAKEIILMDATQLPSDKANVWYLDTSCNNHMAGDKNWFTKLD